MEIHVRCISKNNYRWGKKYISKFVGFRKKIKIFLPDLESSLNRPDGPSGFSKDFALSKRSFVTTYLDSVKQSSFPFESLSSSKEIIWEKKVSVTQSYHILYSLGMQLNKCWRISKFFRLCQVLVKRLSFRQFKTMINIVFILPMVAAAGLEWYVINQAKNVSVAWCPGEGFLEIVFCFFFLQNDSLRLSRQIIKMAATGDGSK